MELLHCLTPAVTCGPDLSIAESASQMDRHNVGSVIVIDDAANIVGIITDRDIAIRGVGKGLPPSTPVKDVMTGDVVTLADDADLFDAARQMVSGECRRMPVVGANGALKGVVTLDDLMLVFAHQTDSLANVIAIETALH